MLVFTIGIYKIFLYNHYFSILLWRLPKSYTFPCQHFWSKCAPLLLKTMATPASESLHVESGEYFTDVEQDLPISHQIWPDEIYNICCSQSGTAFCYSSCCWACIKRFQLVQPPPNVTAACFFAAREIFFRPKRFICSCDVDTPCNGLSDFRPKYQKPQLSIRVTDRMASPFSRIQSAING